MLGSTQAAESYLNAQSRLGSSMSCIFQHVCTLHPSFRFQHKHDISRCRVRESCSRKTSCIPFRSPLTDTSSAIANQQQYCSLLRTPIRQPAHDVWKVCMHDDVYRPCLSACLVIECCTAVFGLVQGRMQRRSHRTVHGTQPSYATEAQGNNVLRPPSSSPSDARLAMVGDILQQAESPMDAWPALQQATFARGFSHSRTAQKRAQHLQVPSCSPHPPPPPLPCFLIHTCVE